MLRVNLVQPLANLSGGTKSGRLLVEALSARGHSINIIFPIQPPLPRNLNVRAWATWYARRSLARSAEHHLSASTVSLIPIASPRVGDDDVPDADITIANYWLCREWMDGWPTRTGLPALFVRGHVVDHRQHRIIAAYQAPGVNFVTSSYLAACLAKYGDTDPILVPNGLDPRFDSAGRSRQATPTVGFMFSRGPLKGSDTAKRAIEIVRSQVDDLRVVAFGSSAPNQDWPLPEGTEFDLRPPQDLIPEIYSRCDVWLQPSRNEGFALPGLEAFGCHTPVVSTLCGGPDEYIQEGVNGYLVPVEDHVAMAERAIEILRMPEERWREMSEAAYRRSREFTWERSAEQFEAAIYRILRGEHPIRT